MLMPQRARKNTLESKSELDLHDILCELLKSMGFRYVTKTHGPLERGVDIVFADQTHGLGEIWCAAVVKTGAIGGGATKPSDLDVIVTQVGAALSNGFNHPMLPHKTVYADRVFVITNGHFSAGAQSKIRSSTEHAKYKNIEFWGIERLMREIDEHRPELYASDYPFLLRYLESAERVFSEVRELTVLGTKQQVALADVFVDPILLKLDPDRRQFRTLEEFLESLQRGQKVEAKSIYGRLHQPGARVVVLGEPGSGKSILVRSVLNHVAREYASSLKKPRTGGAVPAGTPATILPIVLSSFDLSVPGGGTASVDDAIAGKLRSIAEESTDDVLALIDRGLLLPLLILDGLDELSDERVRESVAESVCKWADEHGSAGVLVTSRIEEFCRLSGCFSSEFEVLHLLPLEWRQIREIVSNLAGVLHLDKSRLLDTVKAELESLSSRLPSTPMVYTLLAIVLSSAAVKEIPASLTLLYQRFMELLLGQWDASKGVAALFDAKLKEAFLSELAYKLHDQRVAEIQADDLLDSVARYFSEQGLDRGERNAKVVAFVHELSGRNSVLATRRSAYYFRHHSYQEYFAARFAERMRFSPESVVSRALDDWWNNVVFFYCGLIEVLTDAMLQQMRMLDARSPNDHVLRALSFGHYAQAAFQSPLTVKRTAVEYGIDDIVRFRDWLANAIEKEPHGRLARLGGAWMLRVSALLSRQGFGSVVLLPALAAAFDALEGRTDTGSTFRQFLAASAMSSIGHHERLLNVLDKATEPGVKAYLMHRLESITAGRKAELILDKRAKHLMGKIRRQLRRDFSQRIFDPKRRRKQ